MAKKPNPADGAVSLKVLAERKEVEGVSKRTSFNLDPRVVEVEEGFNRPIDLQRVADIKAAWKEGATFPDWVVRVNNGRVIAIDCHHRRLAALELIAEGFPILTVPATEFKGNEADRILFMCGVNDGNPLTPLHLGVQYKKLEAFGWSHAQIAAKRGKSAQHVGDMIKLANGGVDVHQAIERGEITGTAALTVIKKEGSKAGTVIKAAVSKAKASGKTKVTAKNLVPKSKLGDSYVEETKARVDATKKHLLLMFDGLSADNPARYAVQTVLKAMKVPTPTAAPAPADQSSSLTVVRDWLRYNANSETPRIKEAAELLYAGCCGEALPDPVPAPAAVSLATQLQSYGAHPDAAIRQAASVLYKAAASATMPASLVEAIATEMGSAGMVMAETLCPEHAELIAYLRSTGAA